MRTLVAVCTILGLVILLGGAIPVSPTGAFGGAVVAGWIVLGPSSRTRSRRAPSLRQRVATTVVAIAAVALVSVDAGRYLLPAGLGSVVRELVPSARASQGDDAAGMS